MAEYSVNRAGIVTHDKTFIINFIFCDVVSGFLSTDNIIHIHDYTQFFTVIIFIIFIYPICKKDKTCIITIIVIHFYTVYILANLS